MNLFLSILAILLCLWAATLYIRIPAPLGFMLLLPRLIGSAFTPMLALAGAAGAMLTMWLGAHLASGLFGATALLAAFVGWRIGTVQADPADAFGPDWADRLPPRPPGSPVGVRWTRDIPFWMIPGTDRTLLCDIWQPPAGAEPSGLAFIYFHGSAWYILDKDAYTRPLFRRLAARGHVVMDVAYRLYPETDIPGMVGDVKRAVAWLKEHAAEYGVRPDRIVIGGGSAGGHIAQLAGFAPDHPELTPAELAGQDLTVRGIISAYGPSDLAACFRHTNQQRIPGVGATPPDLRLLTSTAPPRLTRFLGQDSARMGLHKAPVAGRLDWLLGGTQDQVPERYALLSPVAHVHSGCPPTLLMQGADDLITPAAATRELHLKLREAGVPVLSLVYPHTDHGFDLVFPGLSPSAQAALSEMEQFLAILSA